MQNSNFLKEHNARHVWHPMVAPAAQQQDLPIIVTGGRGVHITDIDNREVIDAVGGLWNVNLGYSCAPVKEAITRQLDALPYYSIFRGTTNDAVIELSVELADFFEADGMTRAFFTSGGSDGVETALKLARQYHKINGQSGRSKFLSLKYGYHGTHTAGASVNGNANFRAQYEPLLPGCFHLPAPYTYRNPFDESDPKKLADLCVQSIEAEINFQGADTIAAFIMEPILGAGGVIVPHESFMPRVKTLCERNGILLIADEVITAYGRTGSWSGSRHFNVKPDLMSTAKAITNGYFPFGAVMVAEHVAQTFESDTSPMSTIGHGYTYSGHPVGAAAALACLQETRRLNVIDNAATRGQQLYAGCQQLMTRHERVGDVRGGHGLMVALELVSDRSNKTPVDKSIPPQIQKVALDHGVMIRVSGANIILSPPLIISEEEVNTVIAALDQALAVNA